MNGIEIRQANKDETVILCTFLKRPDIDNSFSKPLSQRDLGIEDRVSIVFKKGVWIIATSEERICGCRGLKYDVQNFSVCFTTFVIDPVFRGLGIGQKLFCFSNDYAIRVYKPHSIILDSWDTNEIFKHIALKYGFQKLRAFNDLCKRPDGVKTIEYIKKISN